MLPIAMTTGASVFLIYDATPCLHRFGPFLSDVVGIIQPMFIFSMLFLTFCRIKPKDLKPHRWHWWLLLIQGGLFSLLGLVAYLLISMLSVESGDWVVLIECAMLCLICPTATAAAVVTRKLGGDVPGITTYIILINILAAVLVPLIVPLVHPVAEIDFWMAFSMIMAKVFPLLILPCLAAWLVRYLFPKLHRWFLKFPDLPFYIWSLALCLAIAITTKSIMRSDMSLFMLAMMSLISLICCVFQFGMGRFIGGRYRPRIPVPAVEERGKEVRKITAGQAMGQKNTIFAIWMAYTFMTPESSIVGGFYSIWHNIYNSWQLYRHSRS